MSPVYSLLPLAFGAWGVGEKPRWAAMKRMPPFPRGGSLFTNDSDIPSGTKSRICGILKLNGHPQVWDEDVGHPEVKGLEVRSRRWGPQHSVLQNSETNILPAPSSSCILEHSLKGGALHRQMGMKPSLLRGLTAMMQCILNPDPYSPSFSITSTFGRSKNLPGLLVSMAATTSPSRSQSNSPQSCHNR